MDDYLEALGIGVEYPSKKYVNQTQIQSDLHKIYIINLHKKALDIYDDKRYICNDYITTFPFGIESVADKITINGKTVNELIKQN